PATATVEFSATDDLSGIDYVCGRYKSASGQTNRRECVSGTEASFSVKLNSFAENDMYFLSELEVGDNAGNQTVLEADLSTGFYTGTTIPVATTTVSGAETPDTTFPTLTSVSFNHPSYTVPATAVVDFVATDDLSGLAYVCRTRDILHLLGNILIFFPF